MRKTCGQRVNALWADCGINGGFSQSENHGFVFGELYTFCTRIFNSLSTVLYAPFHTPFRLLSGWFYAVSTGLTITTTMYINNTNGGSS